MSASFYVMHSVDGEECVLHYRETFGAAKGAMIEEARRDRRASLAVWHSTNGILLLYSQRFGVKYTKAGLQAQRDYEAQRNAVRR